MAGRQRAIRRGHLFAVALGHVPCVFCKPRGRVGARRERPCEVRGKAASRWGRMCARRVGRLGGGRVRPRGGIEPRRKEDVPAPGLQQGRRAGRPASRGVPHVHVDKVPRRGHIPADAHGDLLRASAARWRREQRLFRVEHGKLARESAHADPAPVHLKALGGDFNAGRNAQHEHGGGCGPRLARRRQRRRRGSRGVIDRDQPRAAGGHASGKDDRGGRRLRGRGDSGRCMGVVCYSSRGCDRDGGCGRQGQKAAAVPPLCRVATQRRGDRQAGIKPNPAGRPCHSGAAPRKVGKVTLIAPHRRRGAGYVRATLWLPVWHLPTCRARACGASSYGRRRGYGRRSI